MSELFLLFAGMFLSVRMTFFNLLGVAFLRLFLQLLGTFTT